jgi:hypothetical protein
MMLPSHKRAARAWVVAALADAGKPIPLERVVWSNQDAPTLARPYILIYGTGGTRRGPAPERRSTGDHGAATHTARTDGTGTLSFTVVGPVQRESLDDDADAYLAELTPRLVLEELSGAPNPLPAAGLSVASASEAPGLDSLTGASQWETRAALDVTFSTAVVVTSTPGTVRAVEVEGTTTPPPSLIGSFEVSS